MPNSHKLLRSPKTHELFSHENRKPTLEEMLTMFAIEATAESEEALFLAKPNHYRLAEKIVKVIDYEKNDIEEFCRNVRPESLEERRLLGLYTSALINKIIRPDDTIKVFFRSSNMLSYLGCYLPHGRLVTSNKSDHLGFFMKGGELHAMRGGKNSGSGMSGGLMVLDSAESGVGYNLQGGKISVGECDGHAGNYMKAGTIIIKGDCGKSLAVGMAGGRIIVEGDADDIVGESMNDGLVTVKGNARKHIGYLMSGGAIFIGGISDPESLVGERMYGGKIFLRKHHDKVSYYRMGGQIHNPKVEG